MRVRVEMLAAGGHEPPAGAPVLVQILDTQIQDAPATVLAEARSSWGSGPVELDFAPAGSPTVFAHVDVDRDGQIGDGDFITMESYPCTEPVMKVEVRGI